MQVEKSKDQIKLKKLILIDKFKTIATILFRIPTTK